MFAHSAEHDPAQSLSLTPLETDLIPYSASLCLPARSVLVLAPHPDDEVFGCGGAIVQHIKNGHPVCVLILTDGALYAEPDVRQRESMAAAQILGYGTPECWGFPDGGLRYSDELAQRLADRIAQLGADLVYAPSPWEVHPDHRQTQMLAVEAVRRCAADVRLAFYEVGVPLRPNALLDITTVRETKLAAMRCFASQLRHQSYTDHIQALNRFRTYTLPKEVLAAEAFWLLSARELEPSGWTDLFSSMSLGLRSAKPLLGASTASVKRQTPADLKESIGQTSDPISPLRNQGESTAIVSVLIRTMNRPSLQAAIASVVAQSFSGWEIILVNASGHPLTSLPGGIAERVTQTLEPGRPLGRSAAANALLDAARGTYAVFLDDDDQLMPDHLHKLVVALEADLPLIAAYSDVRATLVPGNDDLDTRIHVYQREFDRSLLQFQNYLPIHSMMFRMEAVRRPTVSRFDEGLALFEDWDFWLQLTAKGEFKRVPGVSALYKLDASTGSGHAVANGALRDSMLQRLGARQLGRWGAHDVVRLIDWESQRTQDLEHAEQKASSHALELAQAKAAIAELSQSILAHQVEIDKLGELRLGHLKQIEQAQSAIAGLNQSLFAQQTEIDTLSRLRLDHLQQLEQAQYSIAELNRSMLAQQSEIDRLDHLRLEHLQQLALAQTSIADLERLRVEHLQQLEQARHHIAVLNQSALALEQSLQISNANEFAQQLELEKLARLRLEHLKQLEALGAQLLQIYHSRSWRLTRPLRVTRRLLGWLSSPAPLQLLRNTWRAVRGEIRRHDVSGFVRRLPHYLRNRRTYGAVLTSPVPQGNEQLFKASPPPGRELRLHPDLTDSRPPIDASISVVIPTFNAGLEFRWLLRKLRSQKGLRRLEIVIVDSGSQDQTVAWAKAAGCRVVEISQAEFSHSHARNLGAAHASSEYLIIMVQDAYPIGEYWAYGMLRYLMDHAESGLVAASCSEYSRSDSDMMYDSMIDTHYRFLGCHEQDRIGDYQGGDHMALRSRGQLSDVACLISREIFGKYGYQGDYAEDLDLGIRLIKDGHRVAMLASVKVVHSHNRAAFYYLKRSYVDVIFLVGMFDDFLIPALESVQGLVLGIVSCARHVSALLPALGTKQPGLILTQTLADWIVLCRQQCAELQTQGHCALGDKRLDQYVNTLSNRVQPNAIDGLAQSEARRFTDSFLARLAHFNAFAAEVYGAQDALLQDGLQEAVRKTFAATAGSALGFMYMHRLRSAGPDQALVDIINNELRAGV